jgi:DNA N-6-adenine-methyltransferase (Dam)
VVDLATAPRSDSITHASAEEYTQALAQVMGGGWRHILLGHNLGVPQALGLSTEEWVQQRLGGYVRLSTSERRGVASQLAEAGLSVRETASILGIGKSTIDRDLQSLRAVPDGAPTPDDQASCSDLPVPNGTVAPRAHVANNSGDDEWYTPSAYVVAARQVMGGIDLDPASCPEANATVQADAYFTKVDDGLARPWKGRVWLNPPYGLIERFCTQLGQEYQRGAVTEACALTNNASETSWFQGLMAVASAACFPRGRVRFWHPTKETASPLQGQCIFYLGEHAAQFVSVFTQFGCCWSPAR